MKLQGKTAFVTGGRGGIGSAIVSRFIAEGAEVYAADLSETGSLETCHDDGHHFIKLDVTDEDNVISAMAEVNDRSGKLDILVNAAGIEIEKTIEETSLEEWNRSFAVHCTGTFLTAKYAQQILR